MVASDLFPMQNLTQVSDVEVLTPRPELTWITVVSADSRYDQEHLLLLLARSYGTIFYRVSGQTKAAQDSMLPLRDQGQRLFCTHDALRT